MLSYSQFRDEVLSMGGVPVRDAPRHYRRRLLDEEGIRLYKGTEFGLSIVTGIKGTHYCRPELYDSSELMYQATTSMGQAVGFTTYARKTVEDCQIAGTEIVKLKTLRK